MSKCPNCGDEIKADKKFCTSCGASLTQTPIQKQGSHIGDLQATYTSRGFRRYQLEIRHDGLGQYQVIKGDDAHVVQQKARMKVKQWDERWQRTVDKEQKARASTEKKQLAEERTQQAQAALAELGSILSYTLAIDDAIDWEALHDHSGFPNPRPREPAPPDIAREPQSDDAKYKVELGFLDKLLATRREKKEREARERFGNDHVGWEKERQRLTEEHRLQVAAHEEALASWESERQAFLQAQEEANLAIDLQKSRYLDGDPQAIIEYCDLVLGNSQYPDYFPQAYELDYVPESKVLIVDYQLPSIDQLPTTKQVRYVQSRDEFSESEITQSQLNTLFNDVSYQVTLRTIHELYEADRPDYLASIVFNGYVNSIDPATGQEVNPCILSVQASKHLFGQINLANVDPKACFKSLKGIGSARLQTLTPIAPILRIEREDVRFIEGRRVVEGLDEGDNLAAMDWEEFEHLIRELFEEEFAAAGGEVKVTRASRDGGVDAVAFDPDPIRGGKIVIQAKRYTGTVGVGSVRDLYGTVVNEGANKGILVTTSHYGADAYEFAKGKPLVLIDGNNLLHLLEKHGHKARIDMQEARRLLGER